MKLIIPQYELPLPDESFQLVTETQVNQDNQLEEQRESESRHQQKDQLVFDSKPQPS